eukprot:6969794-Pyramimonas_sp.AAC.1
MCGHVWCWHSLDTRSHLSSPTTRRCVEDSVCSHGNVRNSAGKGGHDLKGLHLRVYGSTGLRVYGSLPLRQSDTTSQTSAIASARAATCAAAAVAAPRTVACSPPVGRHTKRVSGPAVHRASDRPVDL